MPRRGRLDLSPGRSGGWLALRPRLPGPPWAGPRGRGPACGRGQPGGEGVWLLSHTRLRRGRAIMQPTFFPTTAPESPTPCPRPYSIPVYRVTLVRESRLPHTQPQIRNSREAAVLFRQHLGDVDRDLLCAA